MNYFWINTRSEEWSFHMNTVGEPEEFCQLNYYSGKKKQWARCFENARKDDLVVGYQSAPASAIVAIAKISNSLHPNKDGDMVIEVTKYMDLENYVTKEDLKENGLAGIFPVTNGKGTIFDITEYDMRKIFEVIEKKNPKLLNELDEDNCLFECVKTLSLEQAIDYSKRNGTYYLGRKYETNKSYSKEQIKNIFGVNKIDFETRSNIDNTICFFSGGNKDFLDWEDDSSFYFSIRGLYPKEFNFDVTNDNQKYALSFIDLEKYAHIFYKVDNDYEYLGIFQLEITSFYEDLEFDYESANLDRNKDIVVLVDIKGKMV